ncbi:hypothetical protein [uncultured Albimonas sp.]|uniref:helix-turn-helix transcriptional regulator n=1 Tax=uncultured Albimonas sp. TaxID=1331701 RepID=UPI0030EF6E15|tara:strand:- start:1152 stop:1394 length:243 start_codon:yes stop_codon:yes gene_type:complete
MQERDAGYLPTGLRRLQAARHCGVSASTFDDMVRSGILPPARVLRGTLKVWLRHELDDALFALPPDGDEGDNACDALFGT